MTDFVEALRSAVQELPSALASPPRSKQYWFRNPAAWVQERAGYWFWAKQREIVEAIRDHPRVAVQSCHSSGKSLSAAMIAAWWIDCHEPGEAFVVSSAPSSSQVKSILWRELRRIKQSTLLPGEMNLSEWYIGGEMVALGRKGSDYNEHSMQGLHSQNMLVILDEACGLASSLWTAAESIASNKNARILAIGNPDINDSEFATVCADTSGWHKIQIGYSDTPAFTGEQVPPELLDMLISPDWVEARRDAWGEDSALFQSKCLGQFPDRGHDVWSAIQYGAVSRCRLLELPDEESDEHGREAGLDIGGGGDSTVLFERVGARAGRQVAFKDSDPMATVGQIVLTLREWNTTKVKIDVGGIGWGLYGRLRELSSVHAPQGECAHSAEVVGVNFGAASAQPKRFLNKRAELWWGGRERSRLGQWDLGTLDDDTVAELCAPKYEIMDSFGKIKIEKKEEVIKRLGRSPDFADALLLAFYEGEGTSVASVGAIQVFAQADLMAGPRGVPGGGDYGSAGGFVSPFGNTRGLVRPGAGSRGV